MIVAFWLVPAAIGEPSALADTAPAAGTSATVSADPLPTVQQNGVIWSQVTVGDTVYATGSFSETFPAGRLISPAATVNPDRTRHPLGPARLQHHHPATS